ncbi:MAG: hypothetical protein AAGG44_05345, partial [Planctomycetota bacterium]
ATVVMAVGVTTYADVTMSISQSKPLKLFEYGANVTSAEVPVFLVELGFSNYWLSMIPLGS